MWSLRAPRPLPFAITILGGCPGRACLRGRLPGLVGRRKPHSDAGRRRRGDRDSGGEDRSDVADCQGHGPSTGASTETRILGP